MTFAIKILILNLLVFYQLSLFAQFEDTLKIAEDQIAIGDYEEAVKNYTALINAHQNNSDLFTRRGSAYVYLFELKLAEQDLKKALELDPANNIALTFLGELDFINNKHSDGLKKLYKAISADSLNHYAYTHLGLIYDELGQYDSAFYYLTKAITLDSTKSMYWFDRGIYYIKLDKYQEAANDFKKGLELHPNTYFEYMLYSNYIDVYINSEVADSAEAIIIKAEANGHFFYDKRATICFAKGNYVESIDFANKYLETYSSISVWILKADAYNHLSQKSESCECLNTALKFAKKEKSKYWKKDIKDQIKKYCK